MFIMRILTLHVDSIFVKPKEKAIKDIFDEPREVSSENALVVFISVEKGDTDKLVENITKEIENILKKTRADEVVLYPYVHLTYSPAKPNVAFEILLKIEDSLKSKNISVKRAPFGWYKEFSLHVKGHPLSELSRVFYDKDNITEVLESLLSQISKEIEIKETSDKIVVYISKQKEVETKKIYFKRFIILFPDGKEYLIIGERDNKILAIDFKEVENKYSDINRICYEDIELQPIEIDKENFNEDFIRLIDKEALGKPFEEIDENPVRKALEKFGFEWEELSDHGHMRFKPYASLIYDLVAQYSIQVARELDIPIYVIKGTNMFDLNIKPIKEHANLFGERMYMLKTDKSSFVLRYAACFQQFAIAKDLTISYKNLPFGMLEIADSYRYEQPGECLLCFRVRKMTMPDLHIFCKDISEAKDSFIKMHNKIMDEIKKIGRDYELLINYNSPEFYIQYRDLAHKIVRSLGKPVLIYLYPPEEGRYWILNIEYHITDVLGRPREIGTTQIDIKNGERFGIKYIDSENKERSVIILHNAIIGTIERYIYTLFDTALRKKKPTLPLWISPVQVRILPVSDKFTDYALEIAKTIESNEIRVEVDDRDITLSKKIMEAERLWIPYLVIIGEKEMNSGKLSVRVREEGNKEISIEELISEIKENIKTYPKLSSYWPIELSKRPSNL